MVGGRTTPSSSCAVAAVQVVVRGVDFPRPAGASLVADVKGGSSYPAGIPHGSRVRPQRPVVILQPNEF